MSVVAWLEIVVILLLVYIAFGLRRLNKNLVSWANRDLRLRRRDEDYRRRERMIAEVVDRMEREA